jgi:hypothetical protein
MEEAIEREVDVPSLLAGTFKAIQRDSMVDAD